MADSSEPTTGDPGATGPHGVDLALMARLWMRSQGAIAAYVTANTRDFHHAEDVIQDVGKVVAEKFGEYDRGRSFTAWSLGIARNCLLSYYRDSGRNRMVLSEDALRSVEVAVEAVADSGEQRRIALRSCLETLRDRQRELLTLRYEDGLGVVEIASRNETTASTVSVTLYRLRRKLLDCIERRLSHTEA